MEEILLYFGLAIVFILGIMRKLNVFNTKDHRNLSYIEIDSELLNMGRILESSPSNSMVRDYVIELNNSKSKKTGEEWRQIKKTFFAIYRANLVEPHLKKRLYDAVINS